MLDYACSWPVEICGDCPPFDGLSSDAQTAVEEMAVDYLFKWTGQRFGACPIIVRPCRVDCAGSWGPSWPIISLTGAPLLDDVDVPLYTDSDLLLTEGTAAIVSSHCGRCPGSCSCVAMSEALLPGPVSEVLNVYIYGQIMDPSRYRIDDFCRLVRLDGGEWPVCQNLDEAYDGDGAWSVEYVRGQALPPGASVVAGVLACELAKEMCGDSSCRLPKRAQQVTRQGVTVVMPDPITAGMTGIWTIDNWVATQNNPKREGSVSSPDIKRQRITTWTGSSSS